MLGAFGVREKREGRGVYIGEDALSGHSHDQSALTHH